MCLRMNRQNEMQHNSTFISNIMTVSGFDFVLFTVKYSIDYKYVFPAMTLVRIKDIYKDVCLVETTNNALIRVDFFEFGTHSYDFECREKSGYDVIKNNHRLVFFDSILRSCDD